MGGTCKTPLGSAILQDRSGLSLHFLAQISLSVARRTSHDLLLTDKHEGERAESSSPNPHRGQSRNQFLYLTLALPPATTQRPPSRLGSCQDLAGNLAFLAAGVFILTLHRRAKRCLWNGPSVSTTFSTTFATRSLGVQAVSSKSPIRTTQARLCSSPRTLLRSSVMSCQINVSSGLPLAQLPANNLGALQVR